LADPYAWIKAAHVLSLIAWMAAVFYLPRLFVYHADAPAGSPLSETFKVMERRLLRAIMTPAMIATWVFGLILAWGAGFFSSPWLHAKLLLVVILSGIHGFLSRVTRDFAADGNRRSARFFRIINEVPAVIMILIVLLVVLKPF
jgi:putative membrane protein